MSHQHVLTVPGRYEQIKHIVAFVAEGAGEAGLDEDSVFHVELCCDEACTNIIEHAYGGEDIGTITVSYKVQPRAFKIIIQDNGRTFDPANVPTPSVPTEPSTDDAGDDAVIDRLRIGGLGIHFMRKLMDEVHFEFDPDAGNTLIMVKKIQK